MRAELEPIWNAISELNLPAQISDLFGSTFDVSDGSISLQETYIVDFKNKAPTKFNEEYGASIVRLALSMYNTYGGLIVFGIDDKSRLPSNLEIDFDIEAFNAFVKECSGEKFEALCKRYKLKDDSVVTVVLIPKRGSSLPARLTRKLCAYPAGSLWVRERHEVLSVSSEHFQIIYSRRDSYPTEEIHNSAIQRSLPPKPATIKQFVGREEILMNLWDWAMHGDQPRVYLHGPGGSGKSAIAYEFCHSISTSTSEIRFSSGERLDYVVFLSAKETELDTESAKVREFTNRQFADVMSMYKSLLIESGFKSELEVSDLKEDELEQDIAKLFSEYTGVIVFDDIDALSRKGLDTAEEFIFMKIVSAARRTRVIYTLRQVPQHARKSSINVPGLRESEVNEFIEVAHQQFCVPRPTTAEIKQIIEATKSLPLLIENVLGLRKFCGSYQEAVRQHDDKGGDDARRYLYQREYDHLDKSGRSREILAALALIGEPVRFTTLADVMDFSRQVVKDAFGECASIFLIMEEDSAGETVYQLSPVARPFIEEISRGMKYFDQIKRKVEFLGRTAASPDEVAMISRLQRLLRSEQYQVAVTLWESLSPEDAVKANPEIRAAVGRSYANVGSHMRTKALECFRYAESMDFFDIVMMRSWYFVLDKHGGSIEEIEGLCLKVIRRPNLSEKFRAEFYNKLGSARLREARALQFGVRDKALPLFSGALQAFMKNLYIAQINGLSSEKTPYILSGLCEDFIAACRGDMEQFFRALDELAGEKHDLAVEGGDVILHVLRTSRHVPFSSDNKQKTKGYLRRTLGRFAKAVVAVSKGPGGMLLVDGLTRLEQALD